MEQHRNREAWLTDLARLVEPIFGGFRIRPYRVTCGWPCRGGIGLRKRAVGECHAPVASSDGTHELFISPLLADLPDVAGTLCHELAHVAAGVEAAHGKGFTRVCRHVGLTKGKPTQVMPGAALAAKLTDLAAPLGPYPHAAMKLRPKVRTKTASVVRLVCECGCAVTISLKHLDRVGPPVCGCGGDLNVAGGNDD